MFDNVKEAWQVLSGAKRVATTAVTRRKQKILLDVGCGDNKQPGFIGMDKRPRPGVDVVHDLERLPWPFVSGSCSIVKMSHVMEHVCPKRTLDIMEEIWRVLEPNGHLVIVTPYGGSARYYQDPTHCNPWTEVTPVYFDPTHPLYQVYKPNPWKIDNMYWDQRGDLEINFTKIARRDKD